ncbi:MAG: hypothetical protein O7C60_01080 [Rickettsia endosymbiont of Ixodes persulcatus]|nr:hypothetical protein [Rickettsia endosymbiont of Ixodes persulcatus]
MSTVGKHRDEKKLRNYVKNQGADRPSYKAFHQKTTKTFLDTSQLCCEEYHLKQFLKKLIIDWEKFSLEDKYRKTRLSSLNTLKLLTIMA